MSPEVCLKSAADGFQEASGLTVMLKDLTAIARLLETSCC